MEAAGLAGGNGSGGRGGRSVVIAEPDAGDGGARSPTMAEKIKTRAGKQAAVSEQAAAKEKEKEKAGQGRGGLHQLRYSTWRKTAGPILAGRTSFGTSTFRRTTTNRAKLQSDIASKYQSNSAEQHKSERNLERMLVMKKSKWVVSPQKLRFRPVVMSLLMAYSALVIPFQMAELPAMSLAPNQWPVFLLNRAADLILLADLILSFFLAVWDRPRNLWVTNQSFIIRRYLRGRFFVDFIALVPYDLLPFLLPAARMEHPDDNNALYQALAWLMALRLLRLLRISRLEAVFSTYRNQVNWDYSLATLCRYGLNAVLFVHWLACAWWYIAEMELLYDAGTETWMTVFFDGSQAVSTLDKYIAACYWSVMTSATIGYGGPTDPRTQVEYIFNTFAMLIAAFLFGYIVGSVAAVMSTRGLRAQLMYQIMDDVEHFSKACKLPKRLRNKLEDYFKFRCTQAMDHEYHLILLQTMSPALRSEVALYTDTQWLAQLRIFKHAPESLISRLSVAMDQILYPPLETIFDQGHQITRLYVIKRGIIVAAGRIKMAGHAMGEEALLALYKATFSARSMTYSEVNEIDIGAFYGILEAYPQFKRLLRVYAIRKLFHDEVLAYAEAVRRLRKVKHNMRGVVRQKTLHDQRYSLTQGADGKLPDMDGGVPCVSVDFITQSLQESMPNTESRVAHYMLRLHKFEGLSTEDRVQLIHASYLIQRNWKAFKWRRRARIAERNARLLTWSTFMLKMAMGDPSSQIFWMNVAHKHLANMGIETEQDVADLFWALKDSGIEVGNTALAKELKSMKSGGWSTAKRVVPSVVRMRLAGGNTVRMLPNGGLDLEELQQSPNPIMTVMIAIVKWNGLDVSSAINSEVKRSKSMQAPSTPKLGTRRSAKTAELRWTTYRQRLQTRAHLRESDAATDGRVSSLAAAARAASRANGPQLNQRPSRVMRASTSRSEPHSELASAPSLAATRGSASKRLAYCPPKNGAANVGGPNLGQSGGLGFLGGFPSANKYMGSRLSVHSSRGGGLSGVHPALRDAHAGLAKSKSRASKY